MVVKNQKSFTLVELLVTVAIFSLVVSSTAGLFVSALKAQRRSLATQELLNQTGFLMEYMSRAIRMAKKELAAPSCLSENGLNYEKTRGGKGLKFKNSQGVCQEFFWDATTNRLKEQKGGTENYLTSANLEVASFQIKLRGESQSDEDQPRVTFFLEIRGKEKSKIRLQTTISQRNLDIEI